MISKLNQEQALLLSIKSLYFIQDGRFNGRSGTQLKLFFCFFNQKLPEACFSSEKKKQKNKTKPETKDNHFLNDLGVISARNLFLTQSRVCSAAILIHKIDPYAYIKVLAQIIPKYQSRSQTFQSFVKQTKFTHAVRFMIFN